MRLFIFRTEISILRSLRQDSATTAREMFRGFVVANKSISVAVVDVVRVGSLINFVKPKDFQISFNFLVSRLGFLGK